ncbi:MAG: hypothetical protein ACYC0X_31585 [Pirellulaceae bacterium]
MLAERTRKYRGGSSGVDSDGILRIGTNLLDVPAEVIGLVFSNRWAIEIVFRFFKHILGRRHLLSHNQMSVGEIGEGFGAISARAG